MAIVITVLAYFCVLLLFSHLTARKMASNETFYRANRRSPWYMVAFGMVGASISGITFVSVPGMVMRTDMTYLQMCIGFILGYFLVAFLLLPIYYRYNLTTIYGYLQQRLGNVRIRLELRFPLVQDDGCGGPFLCRLYPLAAFRARWDWCSVLGHGSCHGTAYLALYAQGWHQNAGVDGYLSDALYVCCAHPHYLSGDVGVGHDSFRSDHCDC